MSYTEYCEDREALGELYFMEENKRNREKEARASFVPSKFEGETC